MTSKADEDVVAQVMAAAEQVETLDDECRLLLLSAMTGDDDLQAELTGSTVRPASGRESKPPVKEPAGAYLKSVTVAGFRGIGPEARLDLHPAPGVVVVAGRNGSGKSSFSEAVEVALTRTSYRLPEAVRRLGIKARILNVNRLAGSRVEVIPGSDPTKRYLDDAFAVAMDGRADDVVRRRAIPALCRMAVESACKDLFMVRRYGRGESREDVERVWDEARITQQRIALALRDDPRSDVGGWLGERPARRPAMAVVGTASHDGLRRDPKGAVRDVERLIIDIRADAR